MFAPKERTMGHITILDLDESVVARLRARAARNGRSLEQEVREIVVQAARPSRAALKADMLRISQMSPRLPDDSTSLIRQNRDSS